jgi:pyruvate formate lyase activating enzyme
VLEELTGRIFNIQRYSLHDGVGIRTLVFLKGCPLRCQWCSNPESQSPKPDLGFIAARCVGIEACGAPCVPACPLGALRLDGGGKVVVDRDHCDACGKCVVPCGHDALKVVGREMTVAEVMKEIEKDRPFYRRSGGGVTIGGGEPLAQYRFTAALLAAAQDEYLHTAIETSGCVAWPHLAEVLRHVDVLYFDLKHMDPQHHEVLTGQANELILDNLRQVLSMKEPQDVIIRIPLIPGCTDSLENISASSHFLAELGFVQVELVPYHGFGVPKYAQYGMVYPLADCQSVSEDEMRTLREIVRSAGLRELSTDPSELA